MPAPPEPSCPPIVVKGFAIHRAWLPPEQQRAMLDAIGAVLQAAPPLRPVTPGGRPMRVRMTSAGRLGWVSDRGGYRYAPRHPAGTAWPPVPAPVLALWHGVTGLGRGPDCCLVNLYDAEARMGLHQDRDEGDFSFPVVSVSLGDDALFRMGGVQRGDPTASIWLHSGDVVVMGGPARLAFHGVDRIRPGSSRLIAGGGRINLTLRVVADTAG